MAGSVHNVNDYAPPGYKLAATHYADGKCTHVFETLDEHGHMVGLLCTIGQHDDERAALEAFKAKYAHLPTAAEVIARKAASGNLTSEAAVRFADTLPAPAPKPAKRKGGNGG